MDAYEFTPEQDAQLASDRKEFIENLFRVLQEQVEVAATRSASARELASGKPAVFGAPRRQGWRRSSWFGRAGRAVAARKAQNKAKTKAKAKGQDQGQGQGQGQVGCGSWEKQVSLVFLLAIGALVLLVISFVQPPGRRAQCLQERLRADRRAADAALTT